MKAMPTAHFWALAQHLHRCNHPIYIDDDTHGNVFIRLSSDDTLHDDVTGRPQNLLSVSLALHELQAHKLHNYRIRPTTPCPTRT